MERINNKTKDKIAREIIKANPWFLNWGLGYILIQYKIQLTISSKIAKILPSAFKFIAVSQKRLCID